MPNTVTLFLTFKTGHHTQDAVIGIWLIYFQGAQLYLNVPVYITLLFLIVLTLATSLNKNEGKKGKREGGRKGRKRERKIEMGRKGEREKRKRGTTKIYNILIWFIFTELNNSVCFPSSKLLIHQPFSVAEPHGEGKWVLYKQRTAALNSVRRSPLKLFSLPIYVLSLIFLFPILLPPGKYRKMVQGHDNAK